MATDSDTRSLKIHFFYVALILTLVIIGLVTNKWTGIAEFREYLNVGATVTSLVLGVLAIIYSFVSSGQQSSVLGAVEAAATTTSNSVAKIDLFMKSAQDLQAEASKRAKDLHALTAALSDSVEGIRDETRALVAANTENSWKISSLPDQLGELRGIIEKTDKVSSTVSIDNRAIDQLWSYERIETAVRLSSVFGLTTIECYLKAFELKKDISLRKLAEAMGAADPDYLWGFTVGFASTMLITLGAREEENTVFEIRDVNPALRRCVDAEWKRRDGDTKETEVKAGLAAKRAHALSGLVDQPSTASKLPT